MTTGLTVAPGTSPAIAALSTGGYEIAFGSGGSSNALWTVTDGGTASSTEVYPAQNTSPAATALPGGGYAIAYQAASGHLWTVSSLGGNQDTGLTMTPGSSADRRHGRGAHLGRPARTRPEARRLRSRSGRRRAGADAAAELTAAKTQLGRRNTGGARDPR